MRNTGSVRLPLLVAFVAASMVFWLGPAAAQPAQGQIRIQEPGHVQVQVSAPKGTTQHKVTIQQDPDGTTHIINEAVTDRPDKDVTTIVTTPPPPLKKESVKIRTKPSANAVWVPGYWHWNAASSTYDWVPGVWRRAIPGMHWHPGHWVHFANGYQWVPGFWNHKVMTETTTVTSTPLGTVKTTVVHDAPPRPKVETRPTSPGADYEWVPGHWKYQSDRYVWLPGRWELPPVENMVWVPGKWIHEEGGYTYIAGHWDYPMQQRTYVISSRITP